MNTLPHSTVLVEIKTLKNKLVFKSADKELLTFLESADASDTNTLRNYFGIDIEVGDFYANFKRCSKSPK